MSAETRRKDTPMYAVEDTLPVDELPAGTYFVVGPPLTQKSRLLREALSAGNERGDNALYISTNTDVESLYREFGWDESGRPSNFDVIDCVSQRSGPPVDEAEHTSFVGSPGDLTGVGMYLTSHLSRLADLGESERVRVALDSVSTLLMYEEFETVLRFLHVLKNRLALDDALGLVAVNSETHDDERVRTILGLADGVVELREREGAAESRFIRDGDATAWRRL